MLRRSNAEQSPNASKPRASPSERNANKRSRKFDLDFRAAPCYDPNMIDDQSPVSPCHGAEPMTKLAQMLGITSQQAVQPEYNPRNLPSVIKACDIWHDMVIVTQYKPTTAGYFTKRWTKA